MRLQSSPACYNSRVPDAWDYKVLPKTPTKKWVAEGRFELRTFRTGSANATDTPRPIIPLLQLVVTHFFLSRRLSLNIYVYGSAAPIVNEFSKTFSVNLTLFINLKMLISFNVICQRKYVEIDLINDQQ